MANPYYQTYSGFIDSAAQKFGIPKSLLTSLYDSESSFNPSAVSSKGAIGIAQFMPSTAAQYGVNPWDPIASINGGAQYLSDLYKKTGNWGDAVAAYNAGPGNISAGSAYASSVLQKAGINAQGVTVAAGDTGTTLFDTTGGNAAQNAIGSVLNHAATVGKTILDDVTNPNAHDPTGSSTAGSKDGAATSAAVPAWLNSIGIYGGVGLVALFLFAFGVYSMWKYRPTGTTEWGRPVFGARRERTTVRVRKVTVPAPSANAA